jgi:hypothetical protein
VRPCLKKKEEEYKEKEEENKKTVKMLEINNLR